MSLLGSSDTEETRKKGKECRRIQLLTTNVFFLFILSFPHISSLFVHCCVDYFFSFRFFVIEEILLLAKILGCVSFDFCCIMCYL